jgi:hypothetical protein
MEGFDPRQSFLGEVAQHTILIDPGLGVVPSDRLAFGTRVTELSADRRCRDEHTDR